MHQYKRLTSGTSSRFPVHGLPGRQPGPLISDNNLFRQKGRIYWGKDSLNNTLIWRDTLDISTNLVGRWTAGEKFSNSLHKANVQILQVLVQKLSQMPNSN